MQYPGRYLASATLLFLIIRVCPAQPAARPFPQHEPYPPGIILPSHISRQQLDDSVRAFYTAWKNRYIRRTSGIGSGKASGIGSGNVAGSARGIASGGKQYYVWFEGPDTHKQCVSEGQGYGMIIVALMGGYDKSARSTYDGLFHYYRSHPSKGGPFLMAWAQRNNGRDVDGSSATDGDMDIAYSLLLAAAQWGNRGAINYLEEGRRMISAIMKEEINRTSFSVLLSNSVEHDSRDYFDMRSSDFMPAHFRAFRHVSGDPAWDKVIGNNYELFRWMQQTYSKEAGLLPDFITNIHKTNTAIGSSSKGLLARPARPHYLESRYDGVYNYNACRVPWRIATDAILNGDKRAGAIVTDINHWIRATTKDDPYNISAGYSLEGNDLSGRYYEAMCFISSFAVSAMVGSDNQEWLNKIWDYMLHFRLNECDYYDNSIKMINMIILSGNYWSPPS
jgi:hypothetical protein